MGRPSRNIDQRLLDSGRKLLSEAGCAGLSVRRLADAAGVNPGMFHYHFRSKENFLRTLLQETYDEMFARLELTANAEVAALENLRAALNVIARFVRDNRKLILRLVADAISGETLAADFLRTNMPRHLSVVAALMQAAQKEGSLVRLPSGQMLGFVVGAVGMPILASAALERGALAENTTLARLAADTLPDAALAQRIDLALGALAAHELMHSRKRASAVRMSRA